VRFLGGKAAVNHIGVITDPLEETWGAACGAHLAPDDGFVRAAMSSNCDACRRSVGVGAVNERTWEGKVLGVSPEPSYEAQPAPDAGDFIADAIRRRNGY